MRGCIHRRSAPGGGGAGCCTTTGDGAGAATVGRGRVVDRAGGERRATASAAPTSVPRARSHDFLWHPSRIDEPASGSIDFYAQPPSRVSRPCCRLQSARGVTASASAKLDRAAAAAEAAAAGSASWRPAGHHRQPQGGRNPPVLARQARQRRRKQRPRGGTRRSRSRIALVSPAARRSRSRASGSA